MSRIGILPIDIPNGVEVSVNDLNLIVKSQTGEQKLNFSKDLSISIENKQILVKAKTVNKKTKMIWGGGYPKQIFLGGPATTRNAL